MSRGNRKALLGKNAAEAFRECPACESPNLLKFEGEAFCLHCDWDSIEASVDARFSAYSRDLDPRTTESLAEQETEEHEHASKLIQEIESTSDQWHGPWDAA